MDDAEDGPLPSSSLLLNVPSNNNDVSFAGGGMQTSMGGSQEVATSYQQGDADVDLIAKCCAALTRANPQADPFVRAEEVFECCSEKVND